MRGTPLNAIPLDRASSVPLQQQLYHTLRRLILDGGDGQLRWQIEREQVLRQESRVEG